MILAYFELFGPQRRKVGINPYAVAAVVDESGLEPVRIVLQDGLTYGVRGTFDEVTERLIHG